jgi:hypothetical protein
MILTVIRWIFAALLTVIQAGAFLDGAWFVWISGLLTALYLTISPAAFRGRTGIGYMLPLLGLLSLFLFCSYLDMTVAT